MSDSGGHFCGILLAAGRSTRFGSDKLLHALPDGTPIALASAKAMLAAMPRVVAAVNDDNQALARMLAAEGVEIVPAPTLDVGMGRSLAACVAAASGSDGWVVALADMPFIRPRTISLVVTALATGSPLAAPAFRGRRGHPVGFSAGYREMLLALQGDEGARQVLRRRREELDLIDCEDSGVLLDIDRPSDLHQR